MPREVESLVLMRNQAYVESRQKKFASKPGEAAVYWPDNRRLLLIDHLLEPILQKEGKAALLQYPNISRVFTRLENGFGVCDEMTPRFFNERD